MTGAAGVRVSTASIQGVRAGSSPSAALHSLWLKPVPFTVAKTIIEKHHYLHSLPGGTKLTFGVFISNRLMGVIVFGSGPHSAYRLVKDARMEDCLTLTRLWLSDDLPSNSESRVIGIALRSIKKYTRVKFIVSYADPSQGHLGTIYQATGWIYTGLSGAMPLVDLGDGKARHSRSLSHAYGTHSMKHFESHGVKITLVPQSKKHRYIYFLDKSYETRLNPPTLPYPKREES